MAGDAFEAWWAKNIAPQYRGGSYDLAQAAYGAGIYRAADLIEGDTCAGQCKHPLCTAMEIYAMQIRELASRSPEKPE